MQVLGWVLICLLTISESPPSGPKSALSSLRNRSCSQYSYLLLQGRQKEISLLTRACVGQGSGEESFLFYGLSSNYLKSHPIRINFFINPKQLFWDLSCIFKSPSSPLPYKIFTGVKSHHIHYVMYSLVKTTCMYCYKMSEALKKMWYIWLMNFFKGLENLTETNIGMSKNFSNVYTFITSII